MHRLALGAGNGIIFETFILKIFSNLKISDYAKE
jgi:hypothetical protein